MYKLALLDKSSFYAHSFVPRVTQYRTPHSIKEHSWNFEMESLSYKR